MNWTQIGPNSLLSCYPSNKTYKAWFIPPPWSHRNDSSPVTVVIPPSPVTVGIPPQWFISTVAAPRYPFHSYSSKFISISYAFWGNAVAFVWFLCVFQLWGGLLAVFSAAVMTEQQLLGLFSVSCASVCWCFGCSSCFLVWELWWGCCGLV